MIKVFQDRKSVDIRNCALHAVVDYSCGLRFSELSNTRGALPGNGSGSLFTLNVFGRDYDSADFVCEDVLCAKDEKVEMVTFLLSCDALRLKLRLHILDEGGNSLRMLYQLYDGYQEGVPSVIFFHIPFLAALAAGGRQAKYYPACTLRDKSGADVLHRMRESFYSADIIMPLVVCDMDSGSGFSVSFPVRSDLTDLGSVQNINSQFIQISCEQELACHRVRVNPDASFNDTAELVITALAEGWPEAFDLCRSQWRAQYDFAEYDREDLQWFRSCAVHQFTFLYGKEGFDHQRQQIDVERLLKEGQEFGGFDTVILWNQYPRLGVDERTQWNFYDDFPGGRAALRKAVDQFHAHGVRVLFPFIPWDRNEAESTESMGDELARIARDTGLDGFHLDTLQTLPYSMREKLDQVRPGIVLETQAHPMKKRTMEYITTSWDEFWSADPMPEVDVFRFMHPRHAAPVIGRWLRMQDKDTLIKRAEFGGASIVIWQDIFGRWMPYNQAQKQRIARWKRIFLDHLEIYMGLNPIPLYPTGVQPVYCNVFQDDGGQKQIYAFYNDSDRVQEVKDLKLWRFSAGQAEMILGEGTAQLSGGRLNVSIQPGEGLHVLVSAI